VTQQPEHVDDPWATGAGVDPGPEPGHGPEPQPAPVARQRRPAPGRQDDGERHDRGYERERGADRGERGADAAPAHFERLPPQDLEAEQSVLGGMLLSKDAIADVVEVLKGHDFYRPAHETVFQAILDLYAKGEPADPITVTAELTRRGEIGRVGGPGYVHGLVQTVPTAANAEYYAEIVHERAVLRRLVEAGTRITQMGYAADGDVDDIVNHAQAELYAVTEQRTAEDYLPLSEIMEGALDEIEAIGSRSGQMTGVPTGFTDLDSLTNGLHPGQMIVIAARPAMGKALALDTPLPTPTGWTTMGEVRVGDRLLDARGEPTRVVAATAVLTGRPCYEVRFSDGSAVVADAQHQWLTWDSEREAAYDRAVRDGCAGDRGGARARTEPGAAPYPGDWPSWEPEEPPASVPGGRAHGGATAVRTLAPERIERVRTDPERTGRERTAPARAVPRTTEQLADDLRRPGGGVHAVPAARPLALPEAELPLDPYELGRRLGSGRAGSGVPAPYLRASYAQRLALAQGLIDSCGRVDERGAFRFVSSSRALADAFAELAAGLGCVPRTRRRAAAIGTFGPAHGPAYGRAAGGAGDAGCTDEGGADAGRAQGGWEVVVATPLPLSRRPERALAARTDWGRAQASRVVTEVRPVPSVPVRCVQVDNPDRLYLASRSMIPTHNSTLALDFARACSLKHNMPSVIFSLEMGRNEIAMRLLSAEARVALHHMRSGSMTDEDWTRLARQMPAVTDAPLYIDDSPNLSMMEIRAKCRRLKQRNDLQLIVIDYLQLMQTGSSRRPESRQQEVSEMSRNLKLLAKELEVPVIALSQLNRGPEQRTDKKPMVSDLRESGCLTADTALLRADTGAPVTFAELMERGHEGVLVWSLDERRRLVPAPVTNVFSSGTKPVYRLRLASGRRVKATANHPFRTVEGWTPLGDLAVGSRVAVPRRTPDPVGAGLGWSERRLGLLAHLLGDGCALWKQPAEHTPDDVENLAFVEAAAAAEFGVAARRVLPTWLRELGVPEPRSYERRLPAALYSASREEAAVFLRHLWAADGRVCCSGPDSEAAPEVSYSTSSPLLADGVAALLARFGIVARIREVAAPAGERSEHRVVVADEPGLRTFCGLIGVHGRRGQAVERLAAALPERSARSGAGPEAAPGSEDDVFWDRVVAIEPLGEQPVFDATVKGTHNFVADGVLAHNSIEQDSDMVILLHREDAYEKESPRAGEADLIVAKHRNGPTATITVAFQGHYSRFVDMAQT